MPEQITYSVDGGSAQGWLAQPAAAASVPAVLVLQEWWGVDQHIRDLTGRFAAAGFVALAPDLYNGVATSEPDEARKLAMALEEDAAAVSMVGAANYLCGLAQVSSIGVVGFCMGGSLALLAASRTPRIGAVVACYGGRPIDDQTAAAINAPVLAIYGGQDAGIPPERIAGNRAVLERHHVSHQILVYNQAGHAFMNDTRPQAYDAAAASEAWDQILAFFRQHLES